MMTQFNNDQYWELYRSQEDEIKRSIEEEFDQRFFSVHFDGVSINIIEEGSQSLDQINVDSVDIIDSSLEDINNSYANQILLIFRSRVRVDYNVNVSYVILDYVIYDREDNREYGKETLHAVVSKISEFDVEVTLTSSINENNSLSNTTIEVDFTNMLDDIAIDATELLDDSEY